MRLLARSIRSVVLFLCAGSSGCIYGESRPGTAFDVAAAGAMAASEATKARPEQVLLASNLEFIGDRARYRECTAEDVCGGPPVERPASSIVAVKTIGRTRPTLENGSPGEESDVVRITITREFETSRGGMAKDPARGFVLGGPTTGK